MTITKEVQGQLFSAETNRLICLPSRTTYPSIAPAAGSVSTTSPVGSGSSGNGGVNGNNGAPWTEDEHARFLLGLELFPSGPWRSIANCVGTRTARQTMSHAQKYRQKIARRQRGQNTTTMEQQEQELLQQQLAQQHIGGEFIGGVPPAASASPVASLTTELPSDFHLTSEQIDEIILSLFDSGEEDNEQFLITSDEMTTLTGRQ